MIRQGKYTLADAYLTKRPAAQIAITPENRFDGLISVVPGHRALSSVSPRLENEVLQLRTDQNTSDLDGEDMRREHRMRLKKSVDSLRGLVDVVLIDTPPNLDFLMTSSLIAAGWYVVPVFPSGYDLRGLEVLTRTVDKVRKQYNTKLNLAGVLLGNYDRTTSLDKQVHDLLRQRFTPALVFATTIARSVRYREAAMGRITIFEHPEGKEQASQFVALVKEMINRGAKGAVNATLNPLPDSQMVEQVIGIDPEDVGGGQWLRSSSPASQPTLPSTSRPWPTWATTSTSAARAPWPQSGSVTLRRSRRRSPPRQRVPALQPMRPQ